MSHSLSFFFAVALSFTASAAFAQTQPQRAAMALGVARVCVRAKTGASR